MEDHVSLDDSIDSVIIGHLQETASQEQLIADLGSDSDHRIEEECVSSVCFGKLKFNWTIREFLRVWQRDPDPDDDVDEVDHGQNLLISKNFPSEAGDDRIQFQMKIHLRGHDHEQNDRPFLSVYLVYCGKDSEVRANFEIAILLDGEKRNLRNSLKVCCFNEKEHPAWGFKKFLLLDRLKREPENYIDEDNSLTLVCVINIVHDVGSVDKRRQLQMEKERLSHPWTKFQQDLDKLWADTEMLSDVVFSVGERRFFGHKVILSAGSPVMRKMFLQSDEQNPAEEPSRVHSETRLDYSTAPGVDVHGRVLINVHNIKASVFEEVMRYIYTGTVEESLESITSLLAAANQFELKRLKDNCEKELILQLKKGNVEEMLNLAELHEAPNLKQRALDFLNKCPSQDWQQLATQMPGIIFDIMQIRFQQRQSSLTEDKRRRDVSLIDEPNFGPATPQPKRQRRQ